MHTNAPYTEQDLIKEIKNKLQYDADTGEITRYYPNKETTIKPRITNIKFKAGRCTVLEAVYTLQYGEFPQGKLTRLQNDWIDDRYNAWLNITFSDSGKQTPPESPDMRRTQLLTLESGILSDMPDTPEFTADGQLVKGDLPAGVSAAGKAGKFSATASLGGITVYLGRFDTPQQAFDERTLISMQYRNLYVKIKAELTQEAQLGLTEQQTGYYEKLTRLEQMQARTRMQAEQHGHTSRIDALLHKCETQIRKLQREISRGLDAIQTDTLERIARQASKQAREQVNDELKARRIATREDERLIAAAASVNYIKKQFRLVDEPGYPHGRLEMFYKKSRFSEYGWHEVSMNPAATLTIRAENGKRIKRTVKQVMHALQHGTHLPSDGHK